MENRMNETAKFSFIKQTEPAHQTYNIYQNERRDNSYANEGIGICYVPMQEWEQVYDEDTAYSVGTLFPSLNKQFFGGGK